MGMYCLSEAASDFDRVPDEVLIMILSYLPPRHLLTASEVCKRWLAVATTCASRAAVSTAVFASASEPLRFLRRFKKCKSLEMTIGEASNGPSLSGPEVLRSLNHCGVQSMTCHMRIGLLPWGIDFMRNASPKLSGLVSLTIIESWDELFSCDSFTSSLLHRNASSLKSVRLVYEGFSNRLYDDVAVALMGCCYVTELRLPGMSVSLIDAMPYVSKLSLDFNDDLSGDEVTEVRALLPLPQVRQVTLYGHATQAGSNVQEFVSILPTVFPRIQSLHMQGVCWNAELISVQIPGLVLTIDHKLVV